MINENMLSVSRRYVTNPHFTGKHTGEVHGIYLMQNEAVIWNGFYDTDGRFIVTGYTISKRGD